MKKIIISLILLFGVLFALNTQATENDINSIITNQNIVHEVANYARRSNFKNQTLIINKLSEVWLLLEDEKTANQDTSYNRYESISRNITQDEKEMLARLVWLEARGESNEGQRAVIEVVLNRVLNPRFPNTIRDVIYQKNQFSPANRISTTIPTQKEYANLEHVLNNNDYVTEEAVVFFSTGIQKGRKVFKKIGNHYFQYI